MFKQLKVLIHLRYRWMKNGEDFNWQAYSDRISQLPGHGSLHFTKPRDEDHGTYVK